MALDANCWSIELGGFLCRKCRIKGPGVGFGILPQGLSVEHGAVLLRSPGAIGPAAFPRFVDTMGQVLMPPIDPDHGDNSGRCSTDCTGG